ncbi:MAG: FMN-binding protein [Alphaproteobacteria bacterium]|nr:MAG: FMN-binding protein [Alphaproteobacteria bacterium]
MSIFSQGFFGRRDDMNRRPRVTRGRLPVRMLFALAAAVVMMTLLLPGSPPRADEVIEPPASFLTGAFDGSPPTPAILWLTPEIQQQVEAVLGHRLAGLRLRYWRKGERSVWILNEIGKEEPITAGFVVESGRIVRVSVLVYRESRGYEIRYPQFRGQFEGVGLDAQGRLDRPIDGIAGATLSVNAMIRMARTALLLDRLSMPRSDGPQEVPK